MIDVAGKNGRPGWQPVWVACATTDLFERFDDNDDKVLSLKEYQEAVDNEYEAAFEKLDLKTSNSNSYGDAPGDQYVCVMRLWWTHVWASAHYRKASADERRLIEIRFTLAQQLKETRRRRGITQKALAQQLGIAQPTISRAERASNCVSLDIGVRCLIALGCSDAEIARACDPSQQPGIQLLRKRASQPMSPPARAGGPAAPTGEHRFLRKGSKVLQRLR